MMKTAMAIALLGCCSLPAQAQITQYDYRLGNTRVFNGYSSDYEQGYTGYQHQFGNTTTTDIYGNNGQSQHCYSNRLGNAVVTNCY